MRGPAVLAAAACLAPPSRAAVAKIRTTPPRSPWSGDPGGQRDRHVPLRSALPRIDVSRRGFGLCAGNSGSACYLRALGRPAHTPPRSGTRPAPGRFPGGRLRLPAPPARRGAGRGDLPNRGDRGRGRGRGRRRGSSEHARRHPRAHHPRGQRGRRHHHQRRDRHVDHAGAHTHSGPCGAHHAPRGRRWHRRRNPGRRRIAAGTGRSSAGLRWRRGSGAAVSLRSPS